MAIAALCLDVQSFYQYPSVSSMSNAYWLFHYHSTLGKRWNALSYHSAQEAIASGWLRFQHIDGKENLAAILSKPLAWFSLRVFVEPLLFWKGDIAEAGASNSPGDSTIPEGSDVVQVWHKTWTHRNWWQMVLTSTKTDVNFSILSNFRVFIAVEFFLFEVFLTFEPFLFSNSSNFSVLLTF